MPGVHYAQRFFAILELLRQETDPDHCMDAPHLAIRLQEQYHLKVEPRSIRKIIAEMIEAGFPVYGQHKYCWRGTLTSGELEYLLTAIRYGHGLSQEAGEALTQKLLMLGDRRAHADAQIPMRFGNAQMLQTLAVLREAMDTGHQVSFQYGMLDTKGNLVPKLRRGYSRQPKIYNANPYGIVGASGRIYLIASVNRHSDISHYRVDRILNVRKRKALVKPLQKPIHLGEYVLAHPYMYSGAVECHLLQVERNHLNALFDWFGRNIHLEKMDDQFVKAWVYSDTESMAIWLRRYAAYAQKLND